MSHEFVTSVTCDSWKGLDMNENTRSRKWQITINNPVEKDFTHDKIVEILSDMKSLVYYCMSDEIGEKGTFHTHIYIACSNAVRFSTLQNKFNGGHFEMANGTSEQNRDYVFKIGKWKNTEKESTNIEESHVEWGEMPVERQGKRNDIDDLYDMIRSGMDDYDIIETSPHYMLHLDKIEHARQVIRDREYSETFRKLEIVYIWGKSRTGKTRYVMDTYGYSNVYRVSDYEHPFDSYQGEDVILLDEFRSSLRFGTFLKMSEGYPFKLPCRYRDKQACYTKIFVVSNWDLDKQYDEISKKDKDSYDAFLNRFNKVYYFDEELGKQEFNAKEYVADFYPCSRSPFKK